MATTPVGMVEIASRLRVKRATVDQWQVRELLPPPRWTVGGRPCWDWTLDIEPWAQRTGRLPEPPPDGTPKPFSDRLVDDVVSGLWRNGDIEITDQDRVRETLLAIMNDTLPIKRLEPSDAKHYLLQLGKLTSGVLRDYRTMVDPDND